MTEYTPTTLYVQVAYNIAQQQNRDVLYSDSVEEFDRWHAAEFAAAERRGAVRALREFADVQGSWCEAGRDEQIISRRAMRDALRRRADQEEEA